MDKLQPLSGFTWRGWVLLGVALALLALLVSGYNAHPPLFVLIDELFGIDAVFGVLNRFLIPLWLWTTAAYVPDPGLGIAQVCLVLLAVHLHPRTPSVLSIAATSMWALAGQPLLWFAMIELGPGTLLGHLLYWVISLLLIVWVTRSWLVVGGFVALATVHWFLGEWLWYTMGRWGWNLGWNAAFFAMLLVWAAPARRRALARLSKGSPCSTCDYDLAGLAPDALCPECGSARA